MVIAPTVVKKTSKRTAMVFAAIAGIVGYFTTVLGPYSLVVVLIGIMVEAIGIGFFNAILYTLATDLVELLEVKTGERMEGLATASNTIGIKLGTGLGSAILGWMLALGGYDGAAAVQAASVVKAEIIGYLWLPLIMFCICLILSLLWDYEKKRVPVTQTEEA